MIKVLVADGSAVLRSVQKDILKQGTKYEICGDAVSLQELYSKCQTLKPDVLVIDSELFAPRRIEFVFNEIARMRIPSLIFVKEEDSKLPVPNGIFAITKPKFITINTDKLKDYYLIFDQAITKVKQDLMFTDIYNQSKQPAVSNNTVDLVQKSAAIVNKLFRAVCVGVSTGGPGTILELLKDLGSNFPLPIFITQHIDSFFDKNLISWLKQNCPMPVFLAENNIVPEPGCVYFAPSDYHLTFKLTNQNKVMLFLNHDEPINYLRPAVDKMFESAVEVYKDKCIGVLLTGMGSDGAKGCCQIKNAGGYTITQSEESCVIYGMPKAAVDAGGSMEVLPLNKIASRLNQLCLR